MLTLLSPAKKQDFVHQHPDCEFTKAQTISEVKLLIAELKKYKPTQLKKLMNISDSLANLNFERYQAFKPGQYSIPNAKQAVFAFQGDVYKKLAADNFNQKDLDFMQQKVLILSGLYGYLRPLDLIQPYRLEMKTKLQSPRGNDLYEFWGDKITEGINHALENHNHKTVLNLASNEYFKAVNPEKLQADLIQIDFKEKRNGAYKIIGLNAKRARGLMTRFIIQNRIRCLDGVKKFDLDGYNLSKTLGSEQHLVFVR